MGPTVLEERLALAAVGGDDVDDAVAFDQVELVEVLAKLAGLGVAEVGTVAHREVRCGGAEERGLDLAGALSVGDRVYLRHAKAGELCERFETLLLVEGETIVDEVPTYRGDGKAFL